MKSNDNQVSSASLNFVQKTLDNLLENSFANTSSKLNELKTENESKKRPLKNFKNMRIHLKRLSVSSTRNLKCFWRIKKRIKCEKKCARSDENLSTKLSGKKVFECLQCGKQLTSSDGHKVHLRIHTGEKPYACDQCEKRFSQRNGLKQHLRVHSGERPFACNKCGKKFKQPSGLRYHLKIHTGQKSYPV